MTDSRSGQRPGRASRPPRGPARRVEGEHSARHQGGGGVAATEFPPHIEREHGMLVVEERGWPTEIKRYRLVRPAGDRNRERVLAVFKGTYPEALAHFYRYLHPHGGHGASTRVEAPAAQGFRTAGPPSAEEAA